MYNRQPYGLLFPCEQHSGFPRGITYICVYIYSNNINFRHKLGPIYLVKFPTMYDELNLSIKMGPTCMCYWCTHMHDGGMRDKLFLIASCLILRDFFLHQLVV